MVRKSKLKFFPFISFVFSLDGFVLLSFFQPTFLFLTYHTLHMLRLKKLPLSEYFLCPKCTFPVYFPFHLFVSSFNFFLSRSFHLSLFLIFLSPPLILLVLAMNTWLVNYICSAQYTTKHKTVIK